VAVQIAVGAEPIAGYRLVALIGQGTFGEVWKASSPGGGHVALKFVPLDSAAADVEQRALKYVAGVRHPNLLALFGWWRLDRHLLIGMELADRTLQARLEETQRAGTPGIPFEELLGYLGEAARGLDYLNAPRHPHPGGGPELVSFQHRDVKPTNLLLVGDGVKVGDWGLLRLLEGPSAEHTAHLTPNFAAPEFFHGRTSSRPDQYSLAVTAHYLHTGQLPFSGDPCDAHLHRPPDLARLPRAERLAFERALAKSPADRWPSCREFVEALRGARGRAHAGTVSEATRATPSPAGRTGSGPAPRFHYGGVVPPSHFIGRDRELREARESIGAGQSFLVVGNHRSGKTSFCKKFIHDLMGRPENQSLAAYLNLQQLLDLTVETFLEHTLLNLMGEIARQVFSCKYTDLMRPEPAAGHPHLRDNASFASFAHIFRLVQARTQSASPAPLRTGEFVQYVQDLLDIVRPLGWARFVIVYDEANRLPRELSVDLLVSNEEALNTAGVVSVYVASQGMVEAFEGVADSFGRRVHLGAFGGIADLRRLLARYCQDDAACMDDLPFTAEAVERIWAVTGGWPFPIQLVAGRSFDCASARQEQPVTAGHVEEAHQALRAEKPHWFTHG
jgi:serine/threonine protein kinase